MNNLLENPAWFQYEETPHRLGAPVKIDAILAERMKAFLTSHKVQPMSEKERL